MSEQTTLWQLQFREWQTFARATDERAQRTSDMIRDRGRDIGEALGLGRDYAFHLAHNALCGEGWAEYRTPAKKAMLRRILYFERRSWEPTRIAERIISRAWQRVNA